MAGASFRGAAGAGRGDRVPPSVLDIGRRERRDAVRGRAAIEFGADAEAALDLLELLELAWHDSHGDVTLVTVTVSAPLPVLGLFGPSGTVVVTGRAVDE